MAAVLTRIFGFSNSVLIEDIIQDTFLAAMKTWPVKNIPENPQAWLMRVARNKTINALKKANKTSSWTSSAENKFTPDEITRCFLDHEIKDSQLRVLVACCYPELPVKVQIMLTLKIIGGLSVSEIASGLLMSPAGVKKAIYRARQEMQVTYSAAGIPEHKEAVQRLPVVSRILYLMYSEGYKSQGVDEVIRESLCLEALRLTKLLLDFRGIDKGEVHALLSLMYFGIARFPSRLGSKGELINIMQQGRELWDQNAINAGFHHLRLSRQSQCLSKYHLESSIASIHCAAASYEETDWYSILSLYQKLMKIEDSPVIKLNYAVALSKAKGTEAGLKVMDELTMSSSKDKKALLYAARAMMYTDAENFAAAISCYETAAALAEAPADKSYYASRIELIQKVESSS